MISQFTDSLFNLVINTVIYITNFLLSPINALIVALIPSSYITTIKDNITLFFNTLSSYANFAFSFFGLSNVQLSLIKLMLTFIFTAPLTIKGIKIAISWYNHLKF